MMKYKLLSVENIAKTNIGDYIQALASSQFLPQVDGFIDREKLKDYAGEECKVIMNGWYIHNAKQWPPSTKINPLYVAVHINKSVAQELLDPDGISYLKRYEPIGCRDIYTRDLLLQYGVDAYFSGCMTLTLGLNYESSVRNEDVFFVDPFVPYDTKLKMCAKDLIFLLFFPKLIFKISRKFLIVNNRIKNILMVIRFARLYSRLFTKKTLEDAKYVSQENAYYSSLNNEERMESAKQLVEAYSKASFVVTSRIHCALPCTGMNTPVYFVNREDDSEVSKCRFGGLIDLFHVINVSPDNIVAKFDINRKLSRDYIIQNKNSWKPLAESLSNRCRAFVCKSNG